MRTYEMQITVKVDAASPTEALANIQQRLAASLKAEGLAAKEPCRGTYLDKVDLVVATVKRAAPSVTRGRH